MSTRKLFLNKDMSGIQAPLSVKSLSFHSTSLEHTLVSTRTSIEVVRSACRTERRSPLFTARSAEEVCRVFSAIIGDKQWSGCPSLPLAHCATSL